MVFYVLLTVHLITIFVNDQLGAQFFFLHLFIPVLYMFRATKCSSSEESIISIRPLVYVTICRCYVMEMFLSCVGDLATFGRPDGRDLSPATP